VAIYGGRTERDLPLHDDLAEVAEVHLTTEDGSRGTKGRVTDVMDRILTRDMEVFTCGPNRMMAKVAQVTAQRAIPCQVSLETPMACGYGVCLGCPVPKVDGGYLYACTEGPCIDARRIDWQRGLPAASTSAVAP
jgi:dihydroorotate dehydrogenase electron transfer subunit